MEEAGRRRKELQLRGQEFPPPEAEKNTPTHFQEKRDSLLTAHSSIEDTANARLIVIQASDCVQARLTHTITFRRSVPFP
jgi:hypothetical protein